jgi:hypothetical protein
VEKEFVPYTEALALKELGFDEPCIKGYTEEYKTLINFSDIHTNTSVRNTLPTKPLTAPLYQQAFRFFRDKHNLDSFCSKMYLNGKSYWKITKIETKDTIKSYSNFADSYEKAKLACLEKLIELVKQK